MTSIVHLNAGQILRIAAFSLISAQAQNTAIAQSNEAEAKEAIKPLSIISSIAAIPTSMSSTEAGAYLAKFPDGQISKQFEGGNEYIGIAKSTYNGCWFPNGDSRTKNSIQNGKGLILPVYRSYILEKNRDGDKGIDSWVDWTATQSLHAKLSKDLRLQLLPMSETYKYWDAMKKYISEQYKGDVERYLEISNSGGGIFGQLFGAVRDKNSAYSKTKDPNYRLAGLYRPDYYNATLQSINGIDYVVASNETALIFAYYDLLLYGVYSKLDKESLALNLQKDVAGNLSEVREASRLYYYGGIDDERAKKSSTDSIIASSLLKINIHMNTSDPKYSVYGGYIKILKAIKEIEELMNFIKSSFGYELSISPIEKYRELNYAGVDKTKVFCAAYDVARSKDLLDITDSVTRIREYALENANPLVFAVKGGRQSQLEQQVAYANELDQISSRLKSIISEISLLRSKAQDTVLSSTVPRSFKEEGFTGYIASQKIK